MSFHCDAGENGRAYDPVLGRMLQVDNYIQNPFSSQSYNRYSYVLNNPLKYVDPSGESLVGSVIKQFASRILTTALTTTALSSVGYLIGGYAGNNGVFDKKDAKVGALIGTGVGLTLGVWSPDFVKHLSPWYRNGVPNAFHIGNRRRTFGILSTYHRVQNVIITDVFSNSATFISNTRSGSFIVPGGGDQFFSGLFGDFYTVAGRATSRSIRNFYDSHINKRDAEIKYTVLSASGSSFPSHDILGMGTSTKYIFEIPNEKPLTVGTNVAPIEYFGRKKVLKSDMLSQITYVSILKVITGTINPPMGDACYTYNCDIKVVVTYSIKKY